MEIEDPGSPFFIRIQVAMEYVIFELTHRSTVYVSWLCLYLELFIAHRSTVYFRWLCYMFRLSHIGMDPPCMFRGHDLSHLTWIFACRHLCFESFVFWVWEFLPQWWYIIVLYFLVCWQVSDWLCLLPYTHSTKYFSYHSVLTSYFGGLSVTHYFRHPYDR